MSITIYPSQFNMREDGGYEQLPAIKGDTGAQGVPGVGALPGGTKGQVPVKQSADDYDVAWENPGWKLLWTNPNPSSDFAAQTVSIDLTNYTEVRVDATLNSSSLEYGNEFVFFKGAQIQYFTAFFNLNVTGAVTAATRTAVVSDTGIVFSVGYQKTMSATGGPTTANNRQVPLRIYAR